MFMVDCKLPLPGKEKLTYTEDGEKIFVGKLELEALLSPGHSPGHLVYFFDHPTCPFAFVGDLVFQGSIGRTDLPGCNIDDMQSSIRKVMNRLPDKTVLLPGHMGITTVGDEKLTNPYVREWI